MSCFVLKFYKWFVFYLFLGLTICLSSCNQIQTVNLEAPKINLVQKSKSFKIILKEDHSKGETWHLKNDYNQQLVAYNSSVWHGYEKGIYFNFNALALGQTTLTFVLRHYTDTLDINTYIVKIQWKRVGFLNFLTIFTTLQ